MVALKKIADGNELWAVAPWHAGTLGIGGGNATEIRPRAVIQRAEIYKNTSPEGT